MKVAVYHNGSNIKIEERPKPGIGEGEILVRMRACGICGSDLMEWYRIKKAPRVLGHEMTGEIVESKSDRFRVGSRVFVSHHVPCNKCKYCKEGNHTACETLHKGNYDPGGFSEFVRVPKINVDNGAYILPKELTYEEGTLIEPLACAIRGQRVIGIKKGQKVLVLGSGVAGLMHIQLAKLKGAEVIATDINPFRIKKAKEYGAYQVIDARQELNIKADRVIVCTGAMSAIKQAFQCIDRKGMILLFAIPDKDITIPTLDLWRNELTVVSSYGAAPIDLEESMKLLASGKVRKDMATHRFNLDDIQNGFLTAKQGGESLKVVIVNP